MSRAVGLVGTLVLARYLAPAEYGEVSAAAILTASASNITTFGIGIYLVANRDLTREEAFHATCWFLATGVAAVFVVLAFQRPLATWSDVPSLGRFLPMLTLSVVIERIVYIPERMLVRQLRFRWLSVARALSELAYTGTSVGLAAAGIGPMAIVWGSLARSGLRFLAIVPSVDVREWLTIHRLRLAPLRRIVSYGANVAAASVAAYGMRRWDNLLVSRYFGAGVMGSYNYAYNLADTPAVAVGEQMSDVIGASLPHAEPGARARALVRSCRVISLIMFPLAFGLGAIAPTIVQTFFDQRWASVGSMLVLLSVLSALRPAADILHAYFYACRRPSVVLWIEWVSLAAIVVAISTVGRLGILWTCAAVGAVFVLRTLAAMWFVAQEGVVPISAFLRPLIGPLLACVVMALAIFTTRALFGELAPWVRLLVEVGIGSAVYVAGIFLFGRAALRELLDLAHATFLRREPGVKLHANAK